MRPALRSLPALLALSLAGCATYGTVPVAGASYQQGADFTSYRTFDFLPLPAGTARDVATLDYFAVEGALGRGLGQVGLARLMGGTPDLWFAYYQGGRQVDTAVYGYSTGGNPAIDVGQVPASSLVVDAVDASTRVLVWRGIATDALAGPALLDPAIRQMLQSWPGQRGP
jgi:Domain of unknown function (DUF4136)